MTNSLGDLTNPEFTLQFAGKDYQVRKATLRQVAEYQQKVQELSKNPSPSNDVEIVAFCLYTILTKADSNVTLDFIKDNVRGDIDVLEVLAMLGFMSPLQIEKTKLVQEAVQKKLTSANSSQKSLEEQDGLQTSSEV